MFDILRIAHHVLRFTQGGSWLQLQFHISVNLSAI